MLFHLHLFITLSLCNIQNEEGHHIYSVQYLNSPMRPKLSMLAICTIFQMFGGKLKIEIWTTVYNKYIGLYFQTKAYLILYPALKRVTATTYNYIIQYKQMYVSNTLFYVLLHWDTMIIIIVYTKHFQECFSLWQKQNFRENV